jgi:HlyD family secretion protein
MITKKLILPLIISSILLSCKDGTSGSDAYGNFEATEIYIGSEVNGRAVELTAEEGDLFSTGDVLCRIDTTTYSLQRGQLTARRMSAVTGINQALLSVDVLKTQLQVLQKEYKRISRMLKEQSATQKQFDDVDGQVRILESRILSARAQVQSARSELAVLDAQIAIVNDQLAKCIIKAPVAGTVLEKYREAGELIFPGKPVYKVADLTNVYLRAYVSGGQLSQIKIGQEVEVLFDKDKKSNQSVTGVITWISSSAEFTPKIIQTKDERVDLVYAIKVRVKNDGRIKIGMPGEIKWQKAE